MRVGVKRVSKHEDRYVHLLDPINGRGLLLHYETSLDWARISDAEVPSEREAMATWMTENEYFPLRVPDEEFNRIYGDAKKHGTLFQGMPVEGKPVDFSAAPTVKAIVEEREYDHALRRLAVLEQAARKEAPE